MNAKESLCELLESLRDINKKMQRQLLIDFVVGNKTQDILRLKLEQNELFGCGDKHDEDHFNLVIDQAIRDKLIKQTGQLLAITARGRNFLAEDAPKPYNVNEIDEQNELDRKAIDKAQRMTRQDEPAPLAAQPEHIGQHTRMKIQLIQAMDLRVPLDDFAEQNNISFDEVLDELEEMRLANRDFDISYFVNEVLDDDSRQELFQLLTRTKGDIKKADKEMGDVYTEEEIRLARLVWKR